jgi:RNA recognition motif-containing protein
LVFPRNTKEQVRMRIYVGNLPYTTTEESLREAFEQYGAVESATVVRDGDTGRSRGFGFVEMNSTEEAQAAIDGLNGTELDGRALTVNEARPQQQRRPGGGGGGGSRGGGRRGGGGGGWDRGRY